MTLYVGYIKKTKPSAKVLAAKLGCSLLPLHKQPRKINPGDVIVNYGSSIPIYLPEVLLINKMKILQNVINKRVSRLMMQENGVSTPKVVEDFTKATYPSIARPDYHTQGKQLWLVRSEEEAYEAALQGATHFISFIDNTTEFRVHLMSTTISPRRLFDYTVIKTSIKLPVEENPHPYIKNYENGYKFFSARDYAGPSMLRNIWEVAQIAAASFRLHFCAVDLAASEKGIYVYEINTAPSLTGSKPSTKRSTADLYAYSFENNLLPEYCIVKDAIAPRKQRSIEPLW